MGVVPHNAVTVRRLRQLQTVGSRLRANTAAMVGGPAIRSGELPAALAAVSEPVIAIDVFDTLVERSVAPEHVKILAADRLLRRLGVTAIESLAFYDLRRETEAALCRRNAAEHGEPEFCFAELANTLHARLSAEGLMPAALAAVDFHAAMLAAELAVERRVLTAKAGLPAALAALIASGKRVALLSDFYLPEDCLRVLLANAGFAVNVAGVFLSCDHLASKRTGRLYDVMLRALGCRPSDVVMIGDNPHSDIAMAQRRGIRALLVDDAERRTFYRSAAADVTQAGRLHARIRAAAAAPARQNLTLRATVPSLVTFIERLYGEARRSGLQHLFFIAREGRVLEQMFNAYQDALGLDANERIATHYVLASRRSCFVASLRPLGEEDFAGLFDFYRRISLRDFMRSLRVADPRIDAIARSIGVDADVIEPDLPTSDSFRMVLASPLFGHDYEAIRRNQRANLRAYLEQFGVDLRSHGLALVDVGWKGSIQDCLRKVMPSGVRVAGFYLGLIAAGQSVEDKRGLLFSNVGGLSRDYLVYAENRSLYEILLCADHGSALSYETAASGRIEVMLDDDDDELDFVRREIMPLTADALAAFDEMLAARMDVLVPQDKWSALAARMHADLVFRPWRRDAAWLARARHRENFGVFRTSIFGEPAPPSIGRRLSFLVALVRAPRRVLHGSFWPSYTLYRHGGRPLAWAFAWWRKRSNRRMNRAVRPPGARP